MRTEGSNLVELLDLFHIALLISVKMTILVEMINRRLYNFIDMQVVIGHF